MVFFFSFLDKSLGYIVKILEHHLHIMLIITGVQTAATELSSGKVIVTGTMDANKLVDYVYRRTRKQARIVPQPEPEPEKKEETKEGDDQKPAEEAKPQEKKEDEKPPEEEAAKKEEGNSGDQNKEEKSEENKENKDQEGIKKESLGGLENGIPMDHEENMKRMMYYSQPLYVIERIPPPQLFSDENPNACCIS